MKKRVNFSYLAALLISLAAALSKDGFIIFSSGITLSLILLRE